MQRITRIVTLSITFAVLLAINLPAQAPEPRNGTWELNVAKSTHSPGPGPKSAMRTYDIAGQKIKYVSKGMDAEGKPTLVQYTAEFDGKDYPLTGSTDVDTISLKKIDAHNFQAIQKKAGKVVITTNNVVSPDGKVMTVTSKGTNANGESVNNVQVYDRR